MIKIPTKVHLHHIAVVHRVVKRHHRLIKVCIFVGIAYVVVIVTDNPVIGGLLGHVGVKCFEFLGDCVADRVFPTDFLNSR